MTRTTARFLGLFLAAFLASCSPAGSQEAAADLPSLPALQPHVRSTAGSAELLKAAEHYQVLRGSSAQHSARWSELRDAGDWDALRSVAGAYASVDEEFAVGMREYSWPVEVQPMVERLTADIEAEAAALRLVEAADSITSAQAAVADTWPVDSGAGAQLRIALGLDAQ